MTNSTKTTTAVLQHTTASWNLSYTVGSGWVTATWLDGSGHVINYPVSAPKGRYLAGLVARKGFLKSK
jgi:hypothetical protein